MSASMTTLPRRRPIWVSVLLALLVFSGGAVVGGAGTVLVIVHGIRQAIRHPDEIPAHLKQRLTRRLSLDSTQSASVEQILTRHLAKIAQLRAGIRPDVQIELSGIHQEVREVLSPAQQSKWDDLFDDFVDNWYPPAPPANRE
jgi:hypothetical protein